MLPWLGVCNYRSYFNKNVAFFPAVLRVQLQLSEWETPQHCIHTWIIHILFAQKSANLFCIKISIKKKNLLNLGTKTGD